MFEAVNFYTMKKIKFSEAHAVQIAAEVRETIQNCCDWIHKHVTYDALEDKNKIKVHLMAYHAV